MLIFALRRMILSLLSSRSLSGRTSKRGKGKGKGNGKKQKQVLPLRGRMTSF